MSESETTIARRNLLQSALGLSVLAAIGPTPAQAAADDATETNASPAKSAADVPKGLPGQFDFLSGEWRIKNRKRKADSPGGWDEFEGEATCTSLLGGRVHVEELRIPARDFAGMGLRVLEAATGIWHDIWVNAKAGVVVGPGMPGGFEDGVGSFIVTETVDGKTSIYRSVWDRITPNSCRWHQATSNDSGQTWEMDWEMHWTRHQVF
ncbi:DUF1579 domain-containing protein [Ahniella affigens]|uniref:DUF1579 domain-containing protein n=1 Tax=Ahniella affigens TaxID=2021234 RepID=A0A2P1PWC5_9GAMM|nr:DUF1579 domain-containing protein [Ahniella affigens]AVP99084.1 DUF1579 domain-containing protein [Ahniella affigens]